MIVSELYRTKKNETVPQNEIKVKIMKGKISTAIKHVHTCSCDQGQGFCGYWVRCTGHYRTNHVISDLYCSLTTRCKIQQ